jgi:hypothetical protein
MDPASAIIGLTASLATLGGIVLESARILYKAQNHFKEAPRDIKRLCRQMTEFDILLKEIRNLLNSDHGSRTAPIRMLIISSAQHMQDDLQEFGKNVQKVKTILDSSDSQKKLLGLRLRHVFTESKAKQYHQLISSHSGTLTLYLALLAKLVLSAFLVFVNLTSSIVQIWTMFRSPSHK